MASFPRKLQHQAVGKTQSWARAEQVERSGHDVRILEYQVLVIQQHFDGGYKPGCVTVVDSRPHPRRLGELENPYPRALLPEDVGRNGLAPILPGNLTY